MPIKDIHRNPESANAVALRTMSAYHRAVNLNGTAVEMRDCFKVEDPNIRARLLAEVCLRARFEGAVAHALAPTTANPREVELHCVDEIRSTLGHDVAVDVCRRVHALMKGANDDFLESARDGGAAILPSDLGSLPAMVRELTGFERPTDESGNDGKV